MSVTTKNNLQVIFEDNHLIAINKRAGDIVQGDKTGDKALSEIVKSYIKEKHNKPGNVYLGVVHRIDRPTTGVILFAKTSKAAARMSALFQSKQIEKKYWAILQGEPAEKSAKLKHFLIKNAKQNKSYASLTPKPDHKEAILNYTTVSVGTNYSLLEVTIETGRHHQIRAQMAAIQHPIKGDLKYGAKRSNPDGSICLHAREVRFEHPVKKQEITIQAPAPEDNLWQALTSNI